MTDKDKFIIEITETHGDKRIALWTKGKRPLEIEHLDDKELLALSITKWQIVVQNIEQEEDYIIDGGTNTCALCARYHTPDACNGCPIVEITSRHGCVRTPYEDYEDHYYAHISAGEKDSTWERALEIAQEEVDFLIKVRDDLP